MVLEELQTLSASALDGTANFMQTGSDCKVIGPGNPSNIMDAHGKLCEPAQDLGGWNSGIDQKGGTKVWRTRFDNGCCVQLPGSDSPNMDVPEGQAPPYPFIMTRERMEKDAKTWGTNDWHFQMFNEGRWPRGMAANRIVTRQLCTTNGALREAIWEGLQKKRILCMDAGFTGDRCIVHELAFGNEAWRPETKGEVNASNLISHTPPTDESRQIIERVDTLIVPITGDEVKDAEDQIVRWFKDEAERRGIPPQDCIYEPGMRAGLVQKMSEKWSSRVQVVDFGGKPSEGEVSYDIKVPCREFYYNFVTELWYTFRLIVQCGQFRNLDTETMDEFCMREYMHVGGNKLQVETKKDYKAKTGFSPDRADALVAGIELARRLGFVIRRQKSVIDDDEDSDWMKEFAEKAKKHWSKGRLVTS